MWRADPSRRAVWHAVQSTPATRATAAATEQPVLALLGEVLLPLAPTTDAKERRVIAGLLVHTLVSLLNYSIDEVVTSEEEFRSMVAEIKRMLLAYLFAVATN